MLRPRQLLGLLLVVPLLALVACGQYLTPAKAPPLDPVAGHYVGSGGGGAMSKITALTGRFSQLHPGVDWTLEDAGSDASVGLVAQGQADIGFLSRNPKGGEGSQVTTLPIGMAGTAVAVNRRNPIQGLSREQVRQIFAGEITDWSQVGGSPGKIRVLVRENGSTTRSSFEGAFYPGKAAYAPGTVEVYELGPTLEAINSFENSIGMIDLSARTVNEPRVRMLAIDGVAATQENLNSGDYKVRRPLFLLVRNDIDQAKPAVRMFLDFVRGAEGQRIINGG